MSLSNKQYSEKTELRTAKISLRIGSLHWRHPARCADVLQWVGEYRDTIDEVALFTSEIHPPLPLDEIKQRAAELKVLLPKFKALGIPAGINHLSTIGHLDEYVDYAFNEPAQRMVDANGVTAKVSLCPNDLRTRRYIAESYATLARANPDFLWLDDDIRMGGHAPAGNTCFCDGCLEKFSQMSDRHWTRQTLRNIFNAGSNDERLHWRKLWLTHLRTTMNELFVHIRAAVDEVNPQLTLGWMTCELWYEGMDYDTWFASLSGSNHLPTKARPGGGFYSDNSPLDMIWKSHSIGWQIAPLPQSITDIQSEHENYPYLRLRKSQHIFGTEIGVYIGSGCTGTALNLMGISHDPIDEYKPCFEKVRQWRKFFDAQVAAFARSTCEGLWAAYSKDLFAVKGLETDWFDAAYSPGSYGNIRELFEIGLPMAYHQNGAAVTLLGGDTPLIIPREELMKILSGGVCMDGRALMRLHEMGLGEHAGFTVTNTLEIDTVEELSTDELNGHFNGWHRDTRPSFWKSTTHVLTPLSLQARSLSKVTDTYGKPAGIASGVFENRVGGRVAVFGYSPWHMFHNLAKTTQLKKVSRWLSRDRLPAYVASFEKIMLWCRRDSQGRLAMLLLNASLDTVNSAQLHVNEPQAFSLLRTTAESQTLLRDRMDGPYQVLKIPSLAPWEMVLLRSI